MERLNAFVDGELTPSERAAVAAQIRGQQEIARAHATLARLKACIAESADATPPVAMHLPRKKPSRSATRIGLVGFGAAVLGMLALYGVIGSVGERGAVPRVGRDAVVMLAALPAKPVLPHLDTGGLTLEDVKIDRAGEVRLLVATYRGPHGCVLDLRISPAGTAVPHGVGSSRYNWVVGPLAYELLAHGMPGWRFAVIAHAAEQESRDGRTPDAARGRLREARAAAPPCAG